MMIPNHNEIDPIFDETEGLEGTWLISMRHVGWKVLIAKFGANRASYFRETNELNEFWGQRSRLNADMYTEEEQAAVDDM